MDFGGHEGPSPLAGEAGPRGTLPKQLPVNDPRENIHRFLRLTQIKLNFPIRIRVNLGNPWMNSTTKKAPAVYEALDSPDLRFEATRVDPGGFPEVISAAFQAVR